MWKPGLGWERVNAGDKPHENCVQKEKNVYYNQILHVP